MILFLLDANFQRLAIIDQYVSLIWTTRYKTVGDFELYVPANTDVPYQNGMYIKKANETLTSGNIMRIDAIRLQTDNENGDYYIISGKGFENILASRIVWFKTRITGNAESALYNLFVACFKQAENANRNISSFSIASLKGFTDTMTAEYNGEELLTIVEEVCEAFGYGFRFNGFQFEIYKGTDKSQSESNPVIFSPAFGNVASTDYTQDMSAHKNTCLAYSESSQNAYGRLLVTSGGSNTGFNRYETFVDCMTEEDTALMITAANDTLVEDKKIDIFEGEIFPQYATNDYALGDIITIGDSYGHSAKARITEMIESDSAEGYSIIPSFEVITE